MPFVRSYTRRGRRVRSHFRVRSQVAFVTSLVLMLLWFAYVHQHGSR